MERCADETDIVCRSESWRDAQNNDYAMFEAPGANNGIEEPFKLSDSLLEEHVKHVKRGVSN